MRSSRTRSTDAPRAAASPSRSIAAPDARREDRLVLIVDAEPIVFLALVPLVELDDDVDALAFAHRGHAEEVLDVEDAQAANFDMVPEHVRRRSEDHPRRTPFALHDVV